MSLVRSQYRPRLNACHSFNALRKVQFSPSFCYPFGMTIRPAYWLECGHAWNADLTKPNENWIGKTALCPVCAVVSPVKEKVVDSR